ncbi:DedA family protein [Rhodovarius sp.]|uniref:DedA family protein n=1 Tax=Rhodovarius sp. TaxID=2972673 RepID=UPI0034A3E103
MMDWITGLVAQAGYAGVFVLMLAENLFPPIPSELIMPLAGFSAARGHMSLLGVVLAGVAGTLAGNVVWFELARAFGVARTKRLSARFGRWLGITDEDLDKAQLTLRRHGPWAVFLGRMMPGIRTVISIPAGLIEMPRLVFYGLTALGSTIWVGGLAVLGYWLEERFDVVESWIDPFSKVFLALFVLAFVWPVVRVWMRRRG